MSDLQNAMVGSQTKVWISQKDKRPEHRHWPAQHLFRYQTKVDGGESAAWVQLSSLQLGDYIQVGFVEQPGTLQDGTSFTKRIIRNFDKDVGNGHAQYLKQAEATQKPAPGQSPRRRPKF